MSAALSELRELSAITTHLMAENASTCRLATRARRLLTVTTALAEVDTVEEVTDVVLGIGLSVVEAARGFMATVQGDQLRVIGARGYDETLLPKVQAVSIDDATPVATSVRSKMPVYLASVAEYRDRYPWAYARFGAVSATQAHAALPLIHRGAVIGGLGLSFAKRTAFGASDRTFTRLLAQAAAGALARAMNFDAERASRREAELRARTRADVLAVVAHDLRNPLALIQNTAELLVEADLPAGKRSQLLQASVRAAKQMNRLIGDLLDATRIEGGRLALDIHGVDLRELALELDETFRPLAEQRGIAWESRFPETRILVRADRARVLQALGNLLGNALKFTGAGGRVGLVAAVSEREVALRVTDTGPGIAPDAMRCLFEKFWQATSDRRGVGLGLTIVKGIADAHGGRVDVSSELGRGSTFSLVLPLSDESDPAEHLAFAAVGH